MVKHAGKIDCRNTAYASQYGAYGAGSFGGGAAGAGADACPTDTRMRVYFTTGERLYY